MLFWNVLWSTVLMVTLAFGLAEREAGDHRREGRPWAPRRSSSNRTRSCRSRLRRAAGSRAGRRSGSRAGRRGGSRARRRGGGRGGRSGRAGRRSGLLAAAACFEQRAGDDGKSGSARQTLEYGSTTQWRLRAGRTGLGVRHWCLHQCGERERGRVWGIANACTTDSSGTHQKRSQQTARSEVCQAWRRLRFGLAARVSKSSQYRCKSVTSRHELTVRLSRRATQARAAGDGQCANAAARGILCERGAFCVG